MVVDMTGAEAPEAKAPDAGAPEAKAPEAKAPEAGAPDTKAPEAKAPVAETSLLDSDDSEPEKTEEQKPAEKTEEEAGEDPVPEAYEFTAPEGLPLDEGLTAAFAEAAKGLKLGQKAAQKIVDVATQHAQKALDAQRKAEVDLISGWKNEITSDPNHKQLLADAKLARQHFGAENEGFMELTKQWVGNHPGVIKFLAKIGSQLREAGMDPGANPGQSGQGKTLGETWYPSLNKKK